MGALYCVAYERTRAAPEPWVRELGAAVAFACGYGYGDPGYAPSPAVAAFLEKKTDRLSCEQFPERTALAPPSFTQGLYRYMTLSVGLTWRLFGISWTKLALLFGLLHALSAAAAYGLFRLAAGRIPAAAGTLILTTSPLQLKYLPQLREYAKAPFILTLLLVLGLLVTGSFSRRRLLALAIAYGGVLGVGFGFRNDLLVYTLPFAATVAMFLPVPVLSHLKLKLAALVLCAATFVTCAWPVLTAYRSGSNTGHVALLGLMTPFNAPLGVTASIYDWGAAYDDGFATKVIGSYGERVQHRAVVTPAAGGFAGLSREYEEAVVEYLLLIARHWPADLLIRAYASVLRIVELPFQVRTYTTAAPPAASGGLTGRLYALRDSVLSQLSGLGAPATAAAILAVASADFRVAAWLLASLLYFAGYPAVQFDPRHFFFLEVVPWIAVAVLAVAAWRAGVTARRIRAGDARASDLRIPIRRAVLFGTATIVVLAGALVSLRAYQQRHVTALIEEYLEAPADRLMLERTRVGNGRVLLRAADEDVTTRVGVAAEYLVVDIVRPACDRLLAPVTFRYAPTSGFTDLSQRLDVPLLDGEGPFRIFVPVYSSPGAPFTGLELSDGDCDCIAAVRRVRNLDRLPILLNLTLPPDWRQMKLYQTLTRWEPPSAPYRLRVYVSPPALDPAQLGLVRRTAARPAPVFHSRIVRFDDAGGRLVARGFVRQGRAIVVRWPERPVKKGVCFFARGTLYRGGLTLGILKNELWAASVTVTAPGEFLAVVETPEDGVYGSALANFLVSFNRWNDFAISAAGWVEHGM